MTTNKMCSALGQGLVLLGLWLGPSSPGRAVETMVYYHTDALGSPVAVTDAGGAVIERPTYEPYGKQLSPLLPHDGLGFTGHVYDAATGLNYMQQRYYDPGIGRFLSVDPVSATNVGGSFNRYWYANDNPYRFIDPDGRYSCSTEAVCNAVARFVSTLKFAKSNSKELIRNRIIISKALGYIGEKDKGGPKYVPAHLEGNIAADSDMKGTVSLDLSKIGTDLKGATAIAHEADHDLFAQDLQRAPATEGEVRAMEESAYTTGEAVMAAFGQYITPSDHADDVQGSVDYWKRQQEQKREQAEQDSNRAQ